MSTLEKKGNWNTSKGKLLQRFAQLIQSDLLFAKGKKEESTGRFQVELGKSCEELYNMVARFNRLFPSKQYGISL